MKRFLILSFIVADVLAGGPFLHAQSAGASGTPVPPKCHIQILNGISPGAVDIFIGDKLVASDASPGVRIFSFGWPTEKIDLRLVDKKSGREFKEKAVLNTDGYYCLFLTGDFEPLPVPSTAKPTDPPPVRVSAQFLENKPASSSVQVRFVNGCPNLPVIVKAPHGQTWTIPPNETAVATNLAADLYLDAFLGTKKRGLYLAQTPPVSNIDVVFFPLGENLGFKAMPETAEPPAGAPQP